MAKKIQEYKCPNCGGALAFDSGLQKMKCPFCDSEFEMELLQELDEDLDEAQKQENSRKEEDPYAAWQEGEKDGLRVYVCDSCGGEIIADANTAATTCPFCDNNVVFKGQLGGVLRPDYVLPFKLDKKAAKEALHRHYRKKTLLPKVFGEENHIDEVKGVYVPFWLYDADLKGDYKYQATKTRHWHDSDYEYTETSYYDVTRSGKVSFSHVPVDGSKSMPNDLMESVEPFDFSQAVDFQTAYLAGYFADKYDVTAKQGQSRADTRMKETARDAFRKSVKGYESVSFKGANVNYSKKKFLYVLYPVWLLNTSWNGKKYTFAMNGQTGKIVGDLPIDKAKEKRIFTASAVGTAVILMLLSYWLYLL